MNVSDPRLWLLRQRAIEPSVMIFRATVFVRYRVLSSSVTRYPIKDLNISSKKLVHSAPFSGAPIKIVNGDASRKSRMLYTSSGEAGSSTSGYESRDFEVVPYH